MVTSPVLSAPAKRALELPPRMPPQISLVALLGLPSRISLSVNPLPMPCSTRSASRRLDFPAGIRTDEQVQPSQSQIDSAQALEVLDDDTIDHVYLPEPSVRRWAVARLSLLVPSIQGASGCSACRLSSEKMVVPSSRTILDMLEAPHATGLRRYDGPSGGMPGCEPPAFLARLPPSRGTSAPDMSDDASEEQDRQAVDLLRLTQAARRQAAQDGIDLNPVAQGPRAMLPGMSMRANSRPACRRARRSDRSETAHTLGRPSGPALRSSRPCPPCPRRRHRRAADRRRTRRNRSPSGSSSRGPRPNTTATRSVRSNRWPAMSCLPQVLTPSTTFGGSCC